VLDVKSVGRISESFVQPISLWMGGARSEPLWLARVRRTDAGGAIHASADVASAETLSRLVMVVRSVTGMTLLVLLASMISAGPSGAASTTVVVSPLSTTDLPAGSTNSKPPQLQPGLCAGLNLPSVGPVTTVGFQTGQFDIEEALTISDNAGSTFNEVVNQYVACRVVRPVHGLNVRGTGRRLSLPQVGDTSQSFSFNLTVKGFPVHEDLVVFRRGLSCGVLEFVSPQGAVSSQQVASIASIAASKMGSSSVVDLNHEPASTLLNDACTATFVASAFRVEGHIGPGRLDVYFGSTSEVITVTEKGHQTLRAIKDGPSTYFQGNRSFWQSFIGSRRAASLIAGRWIDMTSDPKDVAGFLNSLNEGVILSLCDVGGSATYGASATDNGVKVITVHQNSKDFSSTVYIEDGSNPYVLRIAARAPKSDSGDIVFSDFGVQPDIAAPRGAIPISQFIGNSGTTA
jgi:hypothetical protein